MSFLFVSSKGGPGKSTLCVTYAAERGLEYYSNDHEADHDIIYSEAIPPERIHILQPNDPLKIPDKTVVFDFGGWQDSRAGTLAKSGKIKAYVVPIYYGGLSDANLTFKVVNAIKKIDPKANIIIVINKTDKEDQPEILDKISKKFGDTVKVFIIDYSRYLKRLSTEGKTVFKIATESGLNKFKSRKIRAQFEKLFNYLDKSL